MYSINLNSVSSCYLFLQSYDYLKYCWFDERWIFKKVNDITMIAKGFIKNRHFLPVLSEKYSTEKHNNKITQKNIIHNSHDQLRNNSLTSIVFYVMVFSSHIKVDSLRQIMSKNTTDANHASNFCIRYIYPLFLTN